MIKEYNLNQNYVGQITRIGSEGDPVICIDNKKVVIIKNKAVPGDVVIYKILRELPKYVFGEIVKVIKHENI